MSNLKIIFIVSGNYILFLENDIFFKFVFIWFYFQNFVFKMMEDGDLELCLGDEDEIFVRNFKILIQLIYM